MVQGKVSPHLCFAWGQPPQAVKQSEMVVLVLGLEIPRKSEAVNLYLLLLMPGLGQVSKRYLGWGLTEGSYCLFEKI